MNLPACLFFGAMLVTIQPAARAATKIEYVVTSEATSPQRPVKKGGGRVTTTIDGPTFHIRATGPLVETSLDDGVTTFFGDDRSVTQSPISATEGQLAAPIRATVEDERLVVGESRPGPVLFGLPTRVYTVDYRCVLVARIAYVIHRRFTSHSRFTMTVADTGVSAAALRVVLSRGYANLVSKRTEAFSGLPLDIDGTIESDDPDAASGVTHLHVRAESLRDDHADAPR